MKGPAEIWQQAADCFEQKLAAVGDDQWDVATGCGDWTVKDLVEHTIFWQANVGRILGADASPEQGWDSVKAAIAGALTDPSALEGTIEGGPMNGMPKHQAMGLATGDALLHAWDLARAIGADDTLPAEAVESVHMGLARVPEQMLRSPNMFGPAVEVADDASAQDKLVAFAGRQP
ncbi:MAG: TIGR03086 family metal-binding protein [Acidimicrobiales bacterium]|nr:TIGR03086 family protein [Acidimicrobiales bacterium]